MNTCPEVAVHVVHVVFTFFFRPEPAHNNKPPKGVCTGMFTFNAAESVKALMGGKHD